MLEAEVCIIAIVMAYWLLTIWQEETRRHKEVMKEVERRRNEIEKWVC